MAPVFNDTMYDYYYDDKDNMIYPGLKSWKKREIYKSPPKFLAFVVFFREINFTKNFVKLISRKNNLLTKIINRIARFMQSSWVKFQANDSKNENGKHNQKSDLQEGSQSLQDWFEHHLKA